MLEQVPCPAEVDYVEDHPLVLLDVVDGEVEPEPDPRVAGVGPDEEVVLVLSDEVHPAQVAYRKWRLGFVSAADAPCVLSL